ncbi:MAG: hypothetical protein AAB492_02450 [Patescibacteria group bacterium]
MNIQKIMHSLLCSILLTLILVPSVSAVGCTNQYGSTVECPQNHIVVNKKVRHPVNMNLFIENLTSNDTAYSPNDTVEYDIAVSSTSNVNYSEVIVSDTLPSYLTFDGGPGTYNKETNILTFTLTNLNAGTTVRTRFTAKVKSSTAFSQDLTCNVVNYVKVTGPDGQTDDDTASLCVQTRVLGVTTLPVAGFEDYAFMIPFAVLAIVGSGMFMALKKARP